MLLPLLLFFLLLLLPATTATVNHHNRHPTTAPTTTTTTIIPHLIYLLVDDWGWANWGTHRDADDEGSDEVVTPNLDQLAADGVVLNHFYAHKYCSPSRASLQTGRFPIHVNVRNDGIYLYNLSDPVSGFAGIPRYMSTMGQKLKDVGYSTHMIGKWDVGMATMDHTPYGRGYDDSLVYFGTKVCVYVLFLCALHLLSKILLPARPPPE
jgi:arylsulfatase A-like enzyme